MAERGGNLPLIAKLERAAVMKRLDPTVQAADAVMVARGDLGVEVPPHRVPVMQKRIISSGRRFGKRKLEMLRGVDAWIGLLAEPHRPGAFVGETLYRILRDQFTRLRDGDRFWYRNHLPPEMVHLVEDQTLARVIRRNTDIGRELPDNVFLVDDRSGPPAPVGEPRPPRNPKTAPGGDILPRKAR